MRPLLLVIIAIALSQALSAQVNLFLDLRMSTDTSCKQQSVCTNTVCFELFAKTDTVGLSASAYDIYIDYSEIGTELYVSDSACLITDGGDTDLGAVGFYRIGGNGGITADQINEYWTNMLTICIEINDLSDITNKKITAGGSFYSFESAFVATLDGYGLVGTANASELILYPDTLLLKAEDFNWYMDADGDGFGNPDSMIVSCINIPNYVQNDEDCNDQTYNDQPYLDLCDGLPYDCRSADTDPDIVTWTGLAENSEWNDLRNWDAQCVPDSSNTVIVPELLDYYPIVNSEIMIKEINVQQNAIFELTLGSVFSILPN